MNQVRKKWTSEQDQSSESNEQAENRPLDGDPAATLLKGTVLDFPEETSHKMKVFMFLYFLLSSRLGIQE